MRDDLVPDFPLSAADKRFLVAKDEWRHGRSDLGYTTCDTSPAAQASQRILESMLRPRPATRAKSRLRSIQQTAGRVIRKQMPALVRVGSFFAAMLILPLTLLYLLQKHPCDQETLDLHT